MNTLHLKHNLLLAIFPLLGFTAKCKAEEKKLASDLETGVERGHVRLLQSRYLLRAGHKSIGSNIEFLLTC